MELLQRVNNVLSAEELYIFERIRRNVESYFNADIFTKSRKQHHVYARKMFILLINNRYDISTVIQKSITQEKVGIYLNYKDRSVIPHHLKDGRNLIETDKHFRDAYNQFIVRNYANIMNELSESLHQKKILQIKLDKLEEHIKLLKDERNRRFGYSTENYIEGDENQLRIDFAG